MGDDLQGAPPITTPIYTPDGRRLHRFRQSSLKTIDTCLEQARLQMSGLLPRWETDAASMGTACHAAFEVALYGLRDDGVSYRLADLIQVAQDTFTELTQLPNFRWVKNTEHAARRYIGRAVTTWYEDVLPYLDPLEMELGFGPLVLHEDGERVIELTGTIDYVDRNLGLLDWKTSTGKAWEPWEKERWDLQATAYTWAAHELGVLEDADEYSFTFVVLAQRRVTQVDVQRIEVRRHEGDWNWLRERALVVARLVEAGLPRWPLNDNHALCSPKWCPAWDECKGRHYEEGWPRPSLPRSAGPATRTMDMDSASTEEKAS